MASNKIPMEVRLWSRVNVLSSIKECWIWPRPNRSRGGYASLSVGNREVQAHALAWRLTFHGPVQPGLIYMHFCDTPPCCNPFHVYPATRLENIRDRNRKQRHAYGSKSGRAKLDESKVLAIRACKGQTAALATKYGVCASVIRAVRRRVTWRHV